MPTETLHDDVLDLPLAHDETAETFATEIEQLRAPLIGRLCTNFPRLDRDKAEDLFQSLVLDLWTDSKYLTVSNLGGWLWTALYHDALDLMAADKAHKAAIKAMRRAKARGDYRHNGQASSSIRKTALASPLAEHIGILSKADQALLEAYYTGDCTLKELAEENGVSRRTIARRIQSARCQVQASLEAEGASKAQPTKGGVVDAQLAKELTAAGERLEAAIAEVGTTVEQGAKLVTKPATCRDLLWGRGIYARAATAHAD